MSQLFHQPHVHHFESSQMYNVNSTPHLQCAIPSSSLFSFPLSAPMISLDSRNPSAPLPDISDRNMDHITLLEHSLCSNFFCCGAQLADFHALLEHFEENHVVVLAPNGKRVYPREGLRAVPLDPASGTSTPSSSRASSVTPASPLTPQTSLCPSPSSPLNHLPGISPPASRKSSFTIPPVYTPFTSSLPVDPADPLLDSSEIVLPAFDFYLQPNFFPQHTPEITPEPSSSSEDEEISESPASPCNSAANGSDHEMDSVFQRPLVRFIGGEKRKPKFSKSRRHHASSSHSKRREKMYRCPKIGCVKAYLNPNGLKYHLEKGTCKYAGDEDDSVLERTVPAKRSRPASPSTPNCPSRTDSPSPPQNAPLNPIPKIEEQSPVNPMPNHLSGVSQPLSHADTTPHSASNNYGHHPAPMNPTWESAHVEKQHPHPYPYPVGVTTTEQWKCKEEEYSSPAPSIHPSQPTPRALLGQTVPQHVATQLPQKQVQFHYPVPTYPNGYLYAQPHRSYFASELGTYDISAQ